MSGYLLDTNVASHIVRGDRPEIISRVVVLPMNDIAISAVTEAEILYGLSRRSYPSNLTRRVKEFLLRVDVLPWDRDAAQRYADLRAVCEREGVILAPLDMMIAAHAIAADATLVTYDKAFARVPARLMKTENWLES
jgi:tRNA(fMet)-specific endonuclease VapC